jgi:UMF1 family MFS transporter
MHRRNVFLWILYDFANSIVSIVFFLYFSQWVVIDRGIADIWFNLTFTISAFLLLLTVPTTGVLLDKYWRRITGLRYTTIGTVIFYGLCAVLAVSGKNIPALVTFTLGLYFFLLSFTFYTPLLNDISPPSRRGKISGLGIGANYLGQMAGLFLALPFANGSFNFFGGVARAETLLPAVIAFFLCALPTLIFFREPHKEQRSFSLPAEIKVSLRETKELLRYPGLFAFFASFFFFNDAVLTAANNFSIFLEQVWRVPDATKTYLLLGILITSALGGAISGFIADRVGHKRTLAFILAGWVVILPFIALVTNFLLFITAVIAMGVWFGANWTVSRSVMSYLAPANRHNLAFGYYGLVERASALVGPIIWGLIATNLVSLGSVRYRIAAAALTVFVVLGLAALRRVRSDSA